MGGRRGTRPGNPRRAARGTPTPDLRPNRETGDFKFPIRDSIMIGDSLPVSRPNRERELGTSGSGRHPSAGPWQFKKERGGRPESAFEGLKATLSLGSCLLYSHPQGIHDFPICGQSPGKRGISRFPLPAESRIGDSLPVSRPNREWGERELGASRRVCGGRRVSSCRFRLGIGNHDS
jgi:hypothetical protein